MADTKLAPFNPENLPQAMDLADKLAQSGLIPMPLRGKPADVLIVLMKGRELGLSPIQALSSIHVIEGKPVASAEMKVGLCVSRRDVCEYFTLAHSSTTKATFRTKRAGSEPVELTWTMEQAKQAGLQGKPNWQRHPEAMLRARCASALATAVYPDLVQGMLDEDEGDEVRERVSGLQPVTEREISNTPEAKPASRTEEVRGAIRNRLAAHSARLTIQDVEPEPVPAADKPAEAPKVEAKPEPVKTPLERAKALLNSAGITKQGEARQALQTATGKKDWAQVTEDDVARIEAHLVASRDDDIPF